MSNESDWCTKHGHFCTYGVYYNCDAVDCPKGYTPKEAASYWKTGEKNFQKHGGK